MQVSAEQQGVEGEGERSSKRDLSLGWCPTGREAGRLSGMPQEGKLEGGASLSRLLPPLTP